MTLSDAALVPTRPATSKDSCLHRRSAPRWPSNVVSQFPAAQVGGLFPVFTFDEFVQLGRGFGPNENKIYTIQPNITMTRGNHNIRSGLDTRSTNVYSTNYGNAGGQIDFTRQFTRSTLNSTSSKAEYSRTACKYDIPLEAIPVAAGYRPRPPIVTWRRARSTARSPQRSTAAAPLLGCAAWRRPTRTRASSSSMPKGFVR